MVNLNFEWISPLLVGYPGNGFESCFNGIGFPGMRLLLMGWILHYTARNDLPNSMAVFTAISEFM